MFSVFLAYAAFYISYIRNIYLEFMALPNLFNKNISIHQIIESRATPFVLSSLGSVGDFVTTSLGLSRGFVETHASYNPIYSIMIFWGAIIILQLTLPREKAWSKSIILVSSLSFLGLVNNSLVLLGVFSGIHI